jgi:outer membrane lipoprotein-sorting protein
MRRWMYGFAALVLVPGLVAAQDKPEPKAIVEKAIEAHGGADALNKLKTSEYDMKGRMTVAGTESDFTGKVVYQFPGKYQMTLDLDAAGTKVPVVQTTNGKATKITVSGQDQKLSDAMKAEVAQTATMQEISLLTPLLDDKKYTLKADKDAEFDGAKAFGVTVSAEGSKDVTLYFDQKTGRLVRTVRKGLSPDEREVVEESVLTDFKKVGDALLVPMAVEVTHDGKKFMSLAITSVKLLDTVDPKRFGAEK